MLVQPCRGCGLVCENSVLLYVDGVRVRHARARVCMCVCVSMHALSIGWTIYDSILGIWLTYLYLVCVCKVHVLPYVYKASLYVSVFMWIARNCCPPIRIDQPWLNIYSKWAGGKRGHILCLFFVVCVSMRGKEEREKPSWSVCFVCVLCGLWLLVCVRETARALCGS